MKLKDPFSQFILDINKQQCTEWIKALRSGKYQKGSGYLCRRKCYCALGVLADINDLLVQDPACKYNYQVKLTSKIKSDVYFIFSKLFDRKGDIIPPIMKQKWIINYGTCNILSLNDNFGFTFPQIADIIEKDVLPILEN